DSATNGQSPPAAEQLAFRYRFTIDGKLQKAAAAITCDNEYTLYLNGKKLGSGKNWMEVGGHSLLPAINQRGSNEILVVGRNAGSGPNPAGLFMEIQLVGDDGRIERHGTSSAWEWSRSLPDEKGKYAQQPEDWQPAIEVPPLAAWTNQTSRPAALKLAVLNFQSDAMVRSSLLKSNDLMRSLGRPNRDQIVSMRPNELTTLEAIDLSNGEALSSALMTGAEHILNRSKVSTPALVDRLYIDSLSRPPTAAERSAAVEMLGEKPRPEDVADLLWAILMQPEFLFVN
ncbi:MAG: hypothetical protein C0478_09265, partial [Planctomyces sp.]|nr:hypothetical protein [Planctomyces sp.]